MSKNNSPTRVAKRLKRAKSKVKKLNMLRTHRAYSISLKRNNITTYRR